MRRSHMLRNNLLWRFKEILNSHSEEVAVVDIEGSYTFRQLGNLSKTIANSICRIANQQNNRVVACLINKSYKLVASNIAISMSRNIYMNLDVKAPIERTISILNQVEPLLLLVDNKTEKSAGFNYPNLPILNVEDLDLKDFDFDSYVQNSIDNDPYVVINTSGSTGVPKSVVLGHKSFIDFFDWTMSKFDQDCFKIVGSLSPSIFDIYSFELMLLLTNASRICIIPESYASFPVKILEFLKSNSVCFIFWVPTIMVNIANFNLLEDFSIDDLRLVWFAGEVFPTKQFNYWHNNLKTTTFVNLYGPIEITLDCTYYIVDRNFSDNEPLPIGMACKNTDLLILDDKGNIVNKGEAGTLYVRGSSLAYGYYNDSSKTELAFVQNPLNKYYKELLYKTGDIVKISEDGLIYFLGRADTLIKHNGYRIELGEIEHVAQSNLPNVDNVCVMYSINDKCIVMVYESVSEIPAKELVTLLSMHIPKYMIPTRFIHMKSMPMNANGKIDRNHLKNVYC